MTDGGVSLRTLLDQQEALLGGRSVRQLDEREYAAYMEKEKQITIALQNSTSVEVDDEILQAVRTVHERTSNQLAAPGASSSGGSSSSSSASSSRSSRSSSSSRGRHRSDLVELSVRGTRFTVPLTTIAVVPDSLLATSIHGGSRELDISPRYFSKILDALRRGRSNRTSSIDSLPEADRPAFVSLVRQLGVEKLFMRLETIPEEATDAEAAQEVQTEETTAVAEGQQAATADESDSPPDSPHPNRIDIILRGQRVSPVDAITFEESISYSVHPDGVLLSCLVEAVVETIKGAVFYRLLYQITDKEADYLRQLLHSRPPPKPTRYTDDTAAADEVEDARAKAPTEPPSPPNATSSNNGTSTNAATSSNGSGSGSSGAAATTTTAEASPSQPSQPSPADTPAPTQTQPSSESAPPPPSPPSDPPPTPTPTPTPAPAPADSPAAQAPGEAESAAKEGEQQREGSEAVAASSSSSGNGNGNGGDQAAAAAAAAEGEGPSSPPTPAPSSIAEPVQMTRAEKIDRKVELALKGRVQACRIKDHHTFPVDHWKDIHIHTISMDGDVCAYSLADLMVDGDTILRGDEPCGGLPRQIVVELTVNVEIDVNGRV
ncbi:unnamed protein product [Vitrella brassicaformis CCMP3155]|uniref:Uncharacterized protein n=1 Tax=Vitrella brassicaformis (strain CCMP3155) TaxID=1169540 RepID=A0A0G4G5U5_VITBC|nr:unnamed protein product [Vitrella brassicaformis CCMP3155]|eukprot:CEM23761.1 unnamed protein product [Vitrella brassicaformis CCMP3155]